MDVKESGGVGGEIVVAVALNGGSKSKAIMRWAIEKFTPEGRVLFKLLHIYPRITGVPTPMGNLILFSQVRDDVAAAYRREIEWQKTETFAPFQKLCSSNRASADIVLLEADEVPNVLSQEVARIGAKHLVIGASSNGLFSRKVKGQMLSSLISECAPAFSTVYVVSKGKLESLRPSEGANGNFLGETASASGDSTDSSPRYSSSTLGDGWGIEVKLTGILQLENGFELSTLSAQIVMRKHLRMAIGFLLKSTPTFQMTESEVTVYSKHVDTIPNHSVGKEPSNLTVGMAWTDPGSTSSEYSFPSPLRTIKRTENHPITKSALNETTRECSDLRHQKCTSLSDDEGALNVFARNPRVAGSINSQVSSTKSYTTESNSYISQQLPTFSSVSTLNSSQSRTSINMELERLRMELRHMRGMYIVAQKETKDVSEKLTDLNKLQLEESINLSQVNEKYEHTKELAKMEKKKAEASRKGIEYAREYAVKEMCHRREAELLSIGATKAKEKQKHALAGPNRQYQKFAWDDIVSACNSFSEGSKIGMGSYGTVYKCKFHHTTVAVKVLHSDEGSQSKEFQQELEVLSRIRHPHLLLLLGACPEKGCLVYEFMENGSLEDRLFRKNDTAPITWYDRFRIAWEVASALAFLHNTKPKPIIHRDLKPANILLDQNLVSKIGDAGLCTMLNLDPSSLTMASRTLYKDTSPVGTLCYIDPEYQRTGLIFAKSDVYALGMVILQLLTAKPAVGLTHIIEDAINEGCLMQIVDQDAGSWPVRETTEMALLALQCAELSRKDRPGLNDKVLPVLEKLKELADQAKDIAANGPLAPPSHFICPILKDVMEDPCVAADGYTYDRKAIDMWLKDNDTSPTTNFPLANKNLIPNYTLHYAIMEFKTKRGSLRNTLRSI